MYMVFSYDELERIILFKTKKNIFLYFYIKKQIIKKYILIFLFLITLIIYSKYNPYLDFSELVNKLKRKITHRNPKYIIFLDYINSKVCTDKNAYFIFQYLQKYNFNNIYYLINNETELYKNLLNKNETKNIIPINVK